MIKMCKGCGIDLQTIDKNKDGYVDNIEKDLCYRCFRLKHYGEYNDTNKNNNDYKNILKNITTKDLVVYVTSILNLNLDYLDNFKNCILVLTKRDIIPKSVIDAKIINYIKERYHNINDIFLVSSLYNYNIDTLYQKIINHNSKKIYFIGNTNSGKSTLLNKLIYNYTDLTPDITTSMYPSTTIDTVTIKVNDKLFIDTPGIINEGSITNYVDNKVIKRINPKKEIKPITYQLTGNGSLLVDNLVRIDYSCQKTSMTVYINNGIPIKKINSNRSDLKENSKRIFPNIKKEDIVIEDLCFIKFTNSIDLNIYTNNNITIKRRDNLI